MNNTVTRQVLGKVAMTIRGEYDTSKSYEILDIVTYQGSSYLSKKYNNDSLPTNANDWQLLAQKGDTYELSEEDLQRIAEQITSNANSAFNQNVKEKTDGFNSNVNSKTKAYNTNATEKLDTYNSNHTAKLKEYNDNATSKLNAYNTNTVTKTTEYNSNHTNKLNAYNANASSKIDEYNTNADTRLEEYNTNADTKINEYDEHSKELNNKIVSTRNELERLKSNVLNTGEDTDTFIHLEDSAMAELQEIKVDGVLQQKTTTGKNLLNVPKNLQQIKNDSYSITPVYSNGMLKYIELNGTFNAWTAYSILGAEFTLSPGTYIQSFHKEGTFSNGSVYIDSSLSITSIESDNYLKVLSDDLNVSKYKICVNAGTVCNNLKLYPMIAKEDKASNYEPFTNGASPNPDYPQKIKTITDSLKVTSCNKNVFKITSPLKHVINSGIDISINDNVITLNGTATEKIWPDFIWGIQTNTVIHNKCKYYFSEQPEDCIASINVLSGTATGGSFVIIANDDGSSAFTFNFSNLQNIKTLKANGVNRAYLSGITSGTKFDNFTFEIMLEKGSVATAFERHIESQVQANLPENEFIGKLDETHKDTLRTEYFPEEGQYHLMLDKMIGYKKFIGATDENWTQLPFKPEIFQISVNSIYMLPSANDKGTVLSNYLITTNPNAQWSNNSSCITNLNNEKMIRVRFKDNPFSTVAEYKNWLSTHNLDAYYALETPYTLDLGVIDMPLSYKGITNIFTDSDLFPKITAKYYRTFEKTIQNMQINEKSLKQEITDLNATVSALDTRLKALETKTVEEPTESEGIV